MRRTRRIAILTVAFLLTAAAVVFVLGPPGGNGVPVLTYHQVTEGSQWYAVDPVDFDRQMKFLSDHGYSILTVGELAEAMAGKTPLPPKSAVITFDDGYSDNFLAAFPILEKYGLKATFFVTTGRMGQPEYMDWQQLRTMHSRGMEIGSHTVNHFSLSEISLRELERELIASRLMLENNVGVPADVFANPFGETGPAVVELLRRTGYRAACSSVFGLNFVGQDVYMIRRMTVPASRFGLWDFRVRLWRLYLLGTLGG